MPTTASAPQTSHENLPKQGSRMKSVFRAIYRTPSKEINEKAIIEPSAKVAVVASSIEKIIMALEPIVAEIAEATMLPAKAIESKTIVEASTPYEAKTNPLCKEEAEIEFDFKHVGGGELSTREVVELKSYNLTLGYYQGSIIFGGGDRDELFCVPDQDEARMVKNDRNYWLPKMEKKLSILKKQTIDGSLAYTNIKVGNTSSSSIFFNTSIMF